MQSDREHCISAGMDDFMSKPITIDAMIATLEKWLVDNNGSMKSAA
jgi:CheY-like chemotaxis protein